MFMAALLALYAGIGIGMLRSCFAASSVLPMGVLMKATRGLSAFLSKCSKCPTVAAEPAAFVAVAIMMSSLRDSSDAESAKSGATPACYLISGLIRLKHALVGW